MRVKNKALNLKQRNRKKPLIALLKKVLYKTVPDVNFLWDN